MGAPLSSKIKGEATRGPGGRVRVLGEALDLQGGDFSEKGELRGWKRRALGFGAGPVV